MSIEINIRQGLSELFQLIKFSLPESLANFILDFINVEEWGIALETIYDYLDENEVPISRHAYNLIQQIASVMEINTRDWRSLEYQIQDDCLSP